MPGQSVTFTVIASGAGSSAAIDVDVPNELTISEDVDCVHSALFCDDSSISTLDADTNRLSVTAPGALPGPDGPRATARVTITFSTSVPSSAVPGSQYEIISNVRGLFNLLDPTSATDKQVSTFLNVLDGSGQRVAAQPTPSPTVEPASSVAGDAQIIRFEIDQGDIIPVTSIVPGGEATFNVYQGFRNVEGSFTLNLTLSTGVVLTEEPRCSNVSDESCTTVTVTPEADGTTQIEVLGTASTSDPATLDFGVGVSPNLPFGTDLAIAGRYVVTEASTGEQFETELTIPIFLVDSDFALGNPLEGTLRVTFESSGQLSDDTGGCIDLSQDGRWNPKYFVCDNDSGAAMPSFDGWAILSDTSPTVGEIVVFLNPGTYYITAESLPEGFTLQSSLVTGQVSVSPEGDEYVFESTTPE
jgi:hypothetical protein